MHPGKQLDERIRVHLGALAFSIENANERNLQDMNIYSEGTICKLLNMVWGSNLIDVNKYVEKNHPAIDLADESNKIFVQVTSDSSLDKIRETLDKSAGKYTNLKIFLLKFRKPARKSQIDLGDDRLFANSDVIDMNGLCHLIQDIEDINQKQAIHDYIKQYIPIESEQSNYSIEVYNLKHLFKSLSEVDITSITPDKDEPELSELTKKREKYLDFWHKIEQQYLSVVDLQREQAFKAAFDRFDQANRERLRQYLRYESNQVLFKSNTNDPNEIISLLCNKIKLEVNLPLISDTDVVHFLYYQFYRCNVLPIFEVDL